MDCFVKFFFEFFGARLFVFFLFLFLSPPPPPPETTTTTTTTLLHSLSPFCPPIGHRYLHHSLCSKPSTAEQTTAPAVISRSSHADSDAWSLSSQTRSQTRMAKKRA